MSFDHSIRDLERRQALGIRAAENPEHVVLLHGQPMGVHGLAEDPADSVRRSQDLDAASF